MYYTEHKPKNKKRGRPGNEATSAALNSMWVQSGACWRCDNKLEREFSTTLTAHETLFVPIINRYPCVPGPTRYDTVTEKASSENAVSLTRG